MDDNLKCSVHYLTLSQVGYEEKNTAVSFYHDRTHFDATKRNLYAAFAEEFSLQQGRQFVLHNRIATTPSKMSKLKDQVKELDELLANPANKVVKLSWVSSARLLICLENASLIWLAVDPMSGDLLRVCVDPTLRGSDSSLVFCANSRTSFATNSTLRVNDLSFPSATLADPLSR